MGQGMMGQGMMGQYKRRLWQWFVGLPGPLFKVIFIGLFFLWMYTVFQVRPPYYDCNQGPAVIKY